MSEFYYCLCKKKKLAQLVYKLERMSVVLECIKYIKSIVLVNTEESVYLIIDLLYVDALHINLCYRSICKYLGAKLISKHGSGKITKQEVESIICAPSIKEDSIELKEGVSLKVPWGNKLRIGVVKYIQKGYVYVDINEMGYPLVAKIDVNKIKAINHITGSIDI